MDFYTAFKFLHIVAAIIWLGGGLCLLVMGSRAERSRSDADMLASMQNVASLGNRLFLPAALATLALGIGMVLMAWRFTDLWIMLSLAGFATSLVLGVAVLKPGAERLEGLVKQHGPGPETTAAAQRLLRIGKFDFTILFTIVALMVLKPGPEDLAVLAAMGGVLLMSALVFLGQARHRVPAGGTGAEEPTQSKA